MGSGQFGTPEVGYVGTLVGYVGTAPLFVQTYSNSITFAIIKIFVELQYC